MGIKIPSGDSDLEPAVFNDSNFPTAIPSIARNFFAPYLLSDRTDRNHEKIICNPPLLTVIGFRDPD